MHLHRLIKFLKYTQFHAWYLLSILLMCEGLLHTLYFSSASKDKNCKPPHIRRTESKYQAWNWVYFRNLINPCKCTFHWKDARDVWMKEDNISNITCYKVQGYFYRARWLCGNARDSHSGGPGFKSRCRPTWLRFFRGFPQSRQMLGWIFITMIHLTIIHQIHISLN